jgi:hypothetical protein
MHQQPGLQPQHAPGRAAFHLVIGRVVAYDQPSDTITVELLDGGRVENVVISYMFAGRAFGAAGLPPVSGGSAAATGQNDTYAIILFLQGHADMPIAIGFLHPTDSALFTRPEGTTIDRLIGRQTALHFADGSSEWHAPGVTMRVGEGDPATLAGALNASGPAVPIVLQNSNGVRVSIEGDAIRVTVGTHFYINDVPVIWSDQTPNPIGPPGAAGGGLEFSRQDHTHPVEWENGTPPADTYSGSPGSSETFARGDHEHPIFPEFTLHQQTLPVGAGVIPEPEPEPEVLSYGLQVSDVRPRSGIVTGSDGHISEIGTGLIMSETGRLAVSDFVAPGPHAPEHHAGGVDPLTLSLIAGVITAQQHTQQPGGDLHAMGTTDTPGFVQLANDSSTQSGRAVQGSDYRLTQDYEHVPLPHAIDSDRHTGSISESQHGQQPGGDLHALATTAAPGFVQLANDSSTQSGRAVQGNDSRLLPAYAHDPRAHAATHASGGSDPIAPADIGAAADDHTHTPAELGAAADDHTHTPGSVGAAPIDHTHTPDECGAAPEVHGHAPADIAPQGSGSGLDADTIDGMHAAEFAPVNHTHSMGSPTDPPDNLSQLAGTINDAQHGQRGGGDLHALATTSAPGFVQLAAAGDDTPGLAVAADDPRLLPSEDVGIHGDHHYTTDLIDYALQRRRVPIGSTITVPPEYDMRLPPGAANYGTIALQNGARLIVG